MISGRNLRHVQPVFICNKQLSVKYVKGEHRAIVFENLKIGHFYSSKFDPRMLMDTMEGHDPKLPCDVFKL